MNTVNVPVEKGAREINFSSPLSERKAKFNSVEALERGEKFYLVKYADNKSQRKSARQDEINSIFYRQAPVRCRTPSSLSLLRKLPSPRNISKALLESLNEFLSLKLS